MRLDKSVAMDFLDYMCERWDIKSQGSSWEYWRQLKQLYCSTTGRFLDRNDNREIKKVCVGTNYNLRCEWLIS